MTTYEERLATFTSFPTPWPYNWFQSWPMPRPKTLAAAGFRFVPTESSLDQVECSKCSWRLHDWRHDTKTKYNAFMEHTCPTPEEQAALQGREASKPTPTLQDKGSSDAPPQNKFPELRLNRNDDSSTKPVKESEDHEANTFMMKSYKKRLATFISWPHVSPSAADLAGAGFTYDQSRYRPDQVWCKECYFSKDNWHPEDNPLLEHIRVAPLCKLANEITDEKNRNVRWKKHQQGSSKQHEQQPKSQLRQQNTSKQDQENKAEFLHTTAQASKQEQTDESAMKTAQTSSVAAATSSAPPTLSPAPITPTVTPAVPAAATAVAESSTPSRPSNPVPASSTLPGHRMLDLNSDAKAGKVLEETNVSEESMKKAVVDAGDWVELEFDGEENEDWVQV